MFVRSKHLVSVDYSKKISELMAVVNYREINPNLTEENFGGEGRDIETVEIIILQSMSSIETKDIMQELSERQLRPANLFELLSLAPVLPDSRWTHSVVAFGSLHANMYGCSCAPAVVTLLEHRYLKLYWTEFYWKRGFSFAAVKK